mmetsp:Transcript_34452/g.77875  ORF Transcript_34452/g.77875 Transcript_34452/m.77875 type:complete len:617 (+) Transcript_34452:101-1951(+)|eukprot:CAMPEP_0172589672 /NCGR_PEP_ID=MMETSP1068-20121228/8305_1 /TAXON_ID=35684 /ORGANISM="Pseudopedinella elastica, Strain CCMP716" /LENGTH=616 /DNA_ID=CAMNT_0013385307 /DNA_START=27 /DNA_END=1877 /DNA_ORIENTATION=-
MPLNPNAGSFSFNPGAGSFTPGGGGFTPAAAAPPPPPPAPEPEPAAEAEDDEDAIDESDPLWKAFLCIAEGNKAKVAKMLEDPDEFMEDPKVLAAMNGEAFEEWTGPVIEADTGGDNDWDSDAPLKPVGAADPAPAAAPAPAVPKPPLAAAAAEEDEEDEAPAEEEVAEAEADEREHLNLVFIGHVDAGKSTLSGNILYLTDHVDKRTIEKYEREAKQRNRDSWFLAFIMDTSEEERAKGKTVEVGRAHFATPERRFTILDAPGHKSYVPNMISGASQADIGVLVISARKNEFEAGFEKGGQTKEHAMLAKTLGVKMLLVVVNKMDDPSVKWSKIRYDEITGKLKPFLKKECGFTVKTEVKFIPISALTGANICKPVTAEEVPWWPEMVAAKENNTEQACLLDLLNSLTVEGRDATKPVKIPVLDRYYDRGCVILGKVENGSLSKGDKIVLQPTGTTAVVDALFSDETPVKQVRPGDNVMIRVGLNVEDVCKGFVICNPKQEIAPGTTTFVCFLFLADLTETRPLFTAGYDCILHAHTVETEVVVKRLLGVMDPKTKSEVPRPRFAKQGAQITCVLEVPVSIVVEAFDHSPQLGRITLRDEGKTIAIGKVLRIGDK